MPMGTKRSLWSRREWLALMAASIPVACSGEVRKPAAWITSVAGGISKLGGEPGWMHCQPSSSDWRFPFGRRGHGLAVDPRGQQLVMVARRPGRSLWIRSVAGGRVLEIEAPDNRHYLGHAVFDQEGRYLFVTENVFGAYDPLLPVQELVREAVIGVYDREAGYARVREIPAHGVGSHELRWMPDGTTLVVANGGIYTHPELPRQAQNPDALAPSLVYVDAPSGDLMERLEPRDPQLSLRHLAVHPDGTVVVAMQYQGPLEDSVPLMLSHRRGESLKEWALPEPLRRTMKQYTASVEIHASSRRVAVSAPKAGAVLLFDLDGRFLRAHDLEDAAGLGVNAQGFVVSSGTGWLELLDPQELQVRASRHFPGEAWDNHLVVWSS